MKVELLGICLIYVEIEFRSRNTIVIQLGTSNKHFEILSLEMTSQLKWIDLTFWLKSNYRQKLKSYDFYQAYRYGSQVSRILLSTPLMTLRLLKHHLYHVMLRGVELTIQLNTYRGERMIQFFIFIFLNLIIFQPIKIVQCVMTVSYLK